MRRGRTSKDRREGGTDRHRLARGEPHAGGRARRLASVWAAVGAVLRTGPAFRTDREGTAAAAARAGRVAVDHRLHEPARAAVGAQVRVGTVRRPLWLAQAMVDGADLPRDG